MEEQTIQVERRNFLNSLFSGDGNRIITGVSAGLDCPVLLLLFIE
jgi:hypothetical protein